MVSVAVMCQLNLLFQGYGDDVIWGSLVSGQAGGSAKIGHLMAARVYPKHYGSASGKVLINNYTAIISNLGFS